MGNQGILNNPGFRRGRQVFSLAMVAVLAWVVIEGASQIEWADGMLARVAISAVVGFGGLVAAAASWAHVIRSDLATGMATMGATMPVRHLPLGSVGQMLGMAGLAKAATRGDATMSYAIPAIVAITAAGGAVAAAPAIWLEATPVWLRVLLAVAVAITLLLAWRGDSLLRWSLARVGRPSMREPRGWGVPIAWSTLAAIATSVAFAILSPKLATPWTAAVAFAAAWLSGYLFVIAPAGVGVREGVLVMLLGPPAAASVVVTALAHRVATLIGEVALFVIAWRQGRRWEDGEERGGMR